MAQPARSLLYMIPDRDILFTDGEAKWGFVWEATMVSDLVIRIASVDTPDTIIGALQFKGKTGTCHDYWDGRLNGKPLVPGDYLLTCHLKSAPDKQVQCMLTLTDRAPDPLQVSITGPIMPSRHDSDETIWAMMIAPAVVYKSGQGSTEPIFEKPDISSRSVGHVHGTVAAL